MTAFWPMVGHAYDGALLVVGRAVNGWIDEITVTASPTRTNGLSSCRMSGGHRKVMWLSDELGEGSLESGDGGYSTARSAFSGMCAPSLSAIDPAIAGQSLSFSVADRTSVASQ